MERIKKALDLARSARTAERPIRAPLLDEQQRAQERSTRIVDVDDAQLERNRIVSRGSPPEFVRALNMLRTQVLQRMKQHGMRTLAIVSPASGDGKSLTALNLAISIARDPNHTALLVDLDLRRPSLARLLDIDAGPGIEAHLAGSSALADVLCRVRAFDNLSLLPARAAVAQSGELLANPRTGAMITELRDRYPDRIILFDLPPVLQSDDALAFAPNVDAALVVACEGRTRREDLVRTIELLRGTQIIGTVLNASSEPDLGPY